MNLIQALDELKISYKKAGEHRHVRGEFVGVDCPFCSPSSEKYHLGISVQWGNCSCWKCGRHTLYDSLVATVHNRSIVGDVLRRLKYDRSAIKQKKVEGSLVVPKGVGEMTEAHIAYLQRRGFSAPVIASLWDIQGIGIAPRLQWRLFIPIYLHGRQVSWTTRSIGKEGGRRYINAGPLEESVAAKGILYGQDYLRSSVIVHEGPTDVWRTGPGSTALFGLNYSQAQLEALSGYPLRVVCLDNTDEAQSVAKGLCRDLAPFPGETIQVRLESGEDPGSADDQEIEELREQFL